MQCKCTKRLPKQNYINWFIKRIPYLEGESMISQYTYVRNNLTSPSQTLSDADFSWAKEPDQAELFWPQSATRFTKRLFRSYIDLKFT